MATQTITLTTLPGLVSPTLRVFPDGSDTPVAGSPFTLTEAATAKGRYSVTFSGTLAGFHECFLYAGANQVSSGWANLANGDGVYDVRPQKEVAVDAASTAAVATSVLAAGDVDGFTLEQTLKLCLAALVGKLGGANGTTVTIRAADDSKARITATVDASGNRTTVTLDAAG